MKKICPFIAAAVLLVTLQACQDSKQDCGGDHNERYISFNSFSVSSYNQYSHGGIDAGNVFYSAGYTVSSGKAIINYLITAQNVCVYQDPTIFSTLVLNTADPNISDTLIIKSDNGNDVRRTVSPDNGVLYDADEIYTFTKNTNPSGFLIQNKICFPTQGSWPADSVYFFTKVSTFNMGATYKTTL